MFYLKKYCETFIYIVFKLFWFGFFESELGFIKNCIWMLRTGFARRDAPKSYSEV